MPVFRSLVSALAFTAVAGLAFAQDAPAPPAKVRLACAADYQKLCADTQPGKGAVMRCMRDHFQDVSPDCRAAVMAHRAEMKERRAQRIQGEGGAPPSDTPPSVAPR